MGGARSEANRETAIRFIDALGRGVLDEAHLAADCRWWIPGIGTIPREQFQGFVEGFHGFCIRPPEMVVLATTAEGDRVAVEARCDAELQGGVAYHNTYHFLCEFEDRKIKLAKEYNDTKHSFDTVGVLHLGASDPTTGR